MSDVIAAFVRDALNPALALLPAAMDTPEARVPVIAICLQESRLIHRRQLVGNPPLPVGPAKGLAQFERSGGCKGVVSHPASRYWMAKICKARGIDFNATALWHALETDDVLAAAAARLLLFTDPRKLPRLGDEREAWDLYLRVWRPGAWSRGDAAQRAGLRTKWASNYAQALACITGDVSCN